MIFVCMCPFCIDATGVLRTILPADPKGESTKPCKINKFDIV